MDRQTTFPAPTTERNRKLTIHRNRLSAFGNLQQRGDLILQVALLTDG